MKTFEMMKGMSFIETSRHEYHENCKTQFLIHQLKSSIVFELNILSE